MNSLLKDIKRECVERWDVAVGDVDMRGNFFVTDIDETVKKIGILATDLNFVCPI